MGCKSNVLRTVMGGECTESVWAARVTCTSTAKGEGGGHLCSLPLSLFLLFLLMTTLRKQPQKDGSFQITRL